MKKHHILESLFLSFYSKSLYQDIAKAWKGLALGYLLLVMAICWLPFSYDFHRFLSHYADQILPDIIQQVPIITIAKGKLSIDKPVPYVIKQPGDQQALIIFDTSGKYTSLEHLDAFVLFTRDNVIVRDPSASIPKFTTYSLAKFQDGTISKADIHFIADKIIFWSSVLMYPFSVIIAFVYRFLQILILAGISLLLASLFRITLTYPAAVRLTVVAFTPMLILSTLVEYFSLSIPYWGIISFLLVIGYLGYAVHAQKDIVLLNKEH